MNMRHFVRPIVLLAALLSCPVLASGGAYTINVGGERLEFVPQAEKGYVVKLAEKTGGIHALAGISALGADGAREIRGLDRRGVYTVENDGPAGRNEETIRSLRASSQVAYAAPLFSSNGEAVAIIPEIVVRVKPGTDSAHVEALCEKAGCGIRKPMEFTQQEYLLDVSGPDADAVFAAVGQLSQAACVEWACPNTAFQPKFSGQAIPGVPASGGQLRTTAAGQDTNTPGVFPNDEYFPRQWHLHNTGQSGGTPGADIRAPEAWEITTGDPNIVVAVMDVGVDTEQPDLVNNLVAGYDFYGNDDQPDPALYEYSYGHGTACAGLIAAQGDDLIGVTGVTWNCKIMPVRVAGPSYWLEDAEMATAFRWAAAHGACIVSNSWTWGSPLPILHSAILDIAEPDGIGRHGKGCVVLFAAGNDGLLLSYPANYPEVVAVGATDHNDVRCSYSNYGPELDVVAPSSGTRGEADFASTGGKGWLWTTDIHGPAGFSSRPANPYADVPDYTLFSGTSGAAPIAAGVAALMLSIEPNLTGDEVRYFLERSAKDLGDWGRDDYHGWGRVDARAALDMVLAKRCDLNNDWVVDEKDKAILLNAMETNDLSVDVAPAKKRDGKVDQQDLELLMRYMGTVIPDPNLIAHWKLDETEGTVVYNATGDPAFNASVIGVPLWQPEGGKVGGALQVSGPPNCVRTKLALDPAQGELSVFAWVEGGSRGQVIISQTGGANWLMAGATDGALTTQLRQATPTSKPLVSSSVITDGAWHHIGFVWDGSNRILYVDDMEVARDTQAGLASSRGNLSIGTGSTMAATSFWKGLIDDVRIYDRAVRP